MVNIRQAQEADAAAIAQVKKQVWPDETADVGLVAEVIRSSDHRLQVAAEGNGIVGFVDGFLTFSNTNVRRWEVDLLVVHPDYRRRGIARELITASNRSGIVMRATLARSLIQVSNLGSMRAFALCGYRAQTEICGLFVMSTGSKTLPRVLPDNLFLISVDTINYRGIWIEGELTVAGLQVANALRIQRNLDLAGVVISLRDKKSLGAAQSAGYRLVGHYRYWSMALDKALG